MDCTLSFHVTSPDSRCCTHLTSGRTFPYGGNPYCARAPLLRTSHLGYMPSRRDLVVPSSSNPTPAPFLTYRRWFEVSVRSAFRLAGKTAASRGARAYLPSHAAHFSGVVEEGKLRRVTTARTATPRARTPSHMRLCRTHTTTLPSYFSCGSLCQRHLPCPLWPSGGDDTEPLCRAGY